jgi:hypothetical protein
MKKICILIVTFLMLGSALAQVTPQLGFNVPATGTLNWGGLINQNFSSLDNYFSALTTVPGIQAVKFVMPPSGGFGFGCSDGVLTSPGDACLGLAAAGSVANTASQAITFRARDSGNTVRIGSLTQDGSGFLNWAPDAGAINQWFQTPATVVPGTTGGGYTCSDGTLPLFSASSPRCFSLGVTGAGNGLPSQNVHFHSRTAGGVTLDGDISEDATGNILLRPSSVATIGGVSFPQVAFASLPVTPPLGTLVDCTNCVATTPATCSTATPASCVCLSGTGNVIAKYTNFQNNGNNWYCN